MDLTRVNLLIAQFLFENGYKDSLDVFEKESGVKFKDEQSTKTSELLSILDEYKELTRERIHCKPLEIKPGDGQYCNDLLLEIPGLVGGSNILAVRLTFDGILFAGSTQGLLSVLQLKTPLSKEANNLSLPSEVQLHSAGLIAIDIFSTESRHLILTGSMDRKCCLLEMKHNDDDEPKLLQTFQDHNKFVVRVRWSPSGKYFVTASYDRTICIYRDNNEENIRQFHLVKKMGFKGQVEGISFKRQRDVIIVSIRNDHNLHIIDLTSDEPREIRTINMNLLGDDFVSFTAMDISCSPEDNFILVSTDHNRIIMFDFNSGDQVGNFYGSINDEFSQPRSCWHPSGKYIYSTSQDKCVIVWEVASQAVVGKIRGHNGIVRDLWYCEPFSALVSCGFDGDVRLWHHGEQATT